MTAHQILVKTEEPALMDWTRTTVCVSKGSAAATVKTVSLLSKEDCDVL